MVNFVFLLKNVLVVSLAMNMGLIWKISYYDDEQTLGFKKLCCFNGVKKKKDDAHVSTRMGIVETTTSGDVADGGERLVINLDQ